MTTFVKPFRFGAIALAAMLTFAACGGSDSTSETAVADVDAVGDSGAAPADPAVLEVSGSLEIEGAALAPLVDPDADAARGEMAPVITGQTFDGTDITIGGPTDGPTMLVFLAHWCPHCNDEIPELNTLRDQGALPDDLNIIGISTAVVDDRVNYPPSEWITEKDFTWPVLADTLPSDAFQAYGGSGFPYTVMLLPDGTVNARKSGNESADRIKDWIDSALLV